MTNIKVISRTGKKLERTSLAGKAKQSIEDMIITGEFPQGMRLTETSLADMLEVNAGCIREALLLLEADGLVSKEANKGAKVTIFEASDVTEVYRLRLAIEKLCIEMCMEKNIVPYGLLKKQSKKVISASKSVKFNIIDWVNEDLAFHRIMIANSGNIRMARIWAGLESQIKMLMYRAVSVIASGNLLSTGTSDHEIIIKAINEGNIDMCFSILHDHIIGGSDMVAELIRSSK